MDLKLIKSIIDLISSSEVNEVQIEEGDFKIKVKKSPDVKESTAYFSQPQQAPVPPPVVSSPNPPPSATLEQEASSKPVGNYLTIKSPIVGTFYRAPSPDAADFVTVGDSISVGDTLCIIEAMKIMNEIDSEHKGKIVEVLVENAQPVEFDQPLFLIDPS